MFKKLMLVYSAVVALVLSVVTVGSSEAAVIFAVDASLADVKSDVILWATAILGIALSVFAYRWIRKMVGR